jgi:hypothetical protein
MLRLVHFYTKHNSSKGNKMSKQAKIPKTVCKNRHLKKLHKTDSARMISISVQRDRNSQGN